MYVTSEESSVSLMMKLGASVFACWGYQVAYRERSEYPAPRLWVREHPARIAGSNITKRMLSAHFPPLYNVPRPLNPTTKHYYYYYYAASEVGVLASGFPTAKDPKPFHKPYQQHAPTHYRNPPLSIHVAGKQHQQLHYVPLSIWSTTLCFVHKSQAWQFCATSGGIIICFTLFGSIRSDAKKPPEECHAIWQWNAQIPARSSVLAGSAKGYRKRRKTYRENRQTESRDDHCHARAPRPGASGSTAARSCRPTRRGLREGCRSCAHGDALGGWIKG